MAHILNIQSHRIHLLANSSTLLTEIRLKSDPGKALTAESTSSTSTLLRYLINQVHTCIVLAQYKL